jgi:gluconolactonase
MQKWWLSGCLMSIVALVGLTAQTVPPPAPQTFSGPARVSLDPAFDDLVPADARLDLIKSGFGFTEGSIWVQDARAGYLVFTDMAANVIYKMTPDGTVSVLVDRSGYTGYDIWRVGMAQTNGPEQFFLIGSNGNALDTRGRLIVAGWASRKVEAVDLKTGKRTTLADRVDGKRLGGPNDVEVKSNGTIYFTDGIGGMRARGEDPSRELFKNGAFMIKGGRASLQTEDIPGANGLALSPDEKILYVNGGPAKIINRYDVRPDDTLAGGRLFIDMSDDKTPGITDGMRVDSKGNVWTSCCGGIWVISPQGKKLGFIRSPELVANLTFGDPDFKTLYVAARMGLYKVRVNVAGIASRSTIRSGT